MFLKEFSYKDLEFMSHKFMEVESLIFEDINLIVGRNSEGKSSTVRTLSYCSRLLTQKESIIARGVFNFLFLTEDNKELKYRLAHSWNKDSNTSWIEENIVFDGKVVLRRNKNKTTITSFTEKKEIEITPPNDKIVLHVRRDKKEYPFIEKIILWAETTHFFDFGSFTPQVNFKDVADFLNMIPLDVKRMDDEDMSILIEDMEIMNYFIEDISVIFPSTSYKAMIDVKERGVQISIPHINLSQGMMRTLFILIFINARIKENKISTLIIDDLCEGLDYDRAKKLGKLIYNKCKKSKIQLISTSNDKFLMEVIPIKYWNILTRENNVVKIINYKNSKEKFDNFKFTGLSNFDLFSSDYLL